MQRFIMMLLVILIVGIASLYNVAAKPPEVGNNQLTHIDSVVLVRTTEGQCTGFVVARGMIATAGHCIHPTDLIQLIYYIDGTHVAFKVISFIDKGDCANDWALLMADTGERRPFAFTHPPQLGSLIFRDGWYRNSNGQRMHYGWRLGLFAHRVDMTRLAIPGESGSPVFDTQGRVFGILVCGQGSTMTGLAARTEPLVELIKLMQRRQ